MRQQWQKRQLVCLRIQARSTGSFAVSRPLAFLGRESILSERKSDRLGTRMGTDRNLSDLSVPLRYAAGDEWLKTTGMLRHEGFTRNL